MPATTKLLTDFNDASSPNAKGRYGLSKLVSLYVSRQISELKLAREAGVVVNCVCPGLCTSELSRALADDVRADILKNGKPTSEGSKNVRRLRGRIAGVMDWS